MSAAHSEQAWQTPTRSAAAKLVLLVLADYADERGRAWPTEIRIAERCGLTVAETQSALASLERVGTIRITRGGSSNDYALGWAK